MARAAATDPIRNFKFSVRILPTGRLSTLTRGIDNLGFSVVSGLTVQNEMVAYREGGMNTHPHKLVGQSDYGPVTFTKGVYADQDQLYNWQQFLHSWGQGGQNSTGSVAGSNDYRADVEVSVKDHPISAARYQQPGVAGAVSDTSPVKMKYKLYNCWPASWSLGDLNAGDSSIVIQQMVLNHEGFEIVWANTASGTASDKFSG